MSAAIVEDIPLTCPACGGWHPGEVLERTGGKCPLQGASKPSKPRRRKPRKRVQKAPKTLPDAILFKHESDDGRQPIGPVWVRRAGAVTNYQDSPRKRFDGKPSPAWFDLTTARLVAREEGLPLEEV